MKAGSAKPAAHEFVPSYLYLKLFSSAPTALAYKPVETPTPARNRNRHGLRSPCGTCSTAVRHGSTCKACFPTLTFDWRVDDRSFLMPEPVHPAPYKGHLYIPPRI